MIAPAQLPPRTWLPSGGRNEEVVQKRKKELAAYLSTILRHPDGRWRESSEWRTFLSIPTFDSLARQKSSESINNMTRNNSVTSGDGWMTEFRELQSNSQEIQTMLAVHERSVLLNNNNNSNDEARVLQLKKSIASLNHRIKNLSNQLEQFSNKLQVLHCIVYDYHNI